MQATGAILFLPREGGGEPPLLFQDIVFAPGAVWLAQALTEAGVTRFFVVCHADDRERAAECFPQGTELVTNGTQDAADRLSAFLSRQEGRVAVILKPVLLTHEGARQLLSGAPPAVVSGSSPTGVTRIDAAALAAALEGGASFEDALLAHGDPCNGTKNIWFQGVTPITGEWSGRLQAEYTARVTLAHRLMASGVRIIDPNTVYADPTVTVGRGTVLLPGTILRGKTAIGQNCEIGPNAMIRDCTIGDGVTVNASQLNESVVEEGASIGPFAYIRPHCHVGKGVKVGDFVELKNSVVGPGTKISHLTYVGDSDVGSGVNFGCGTVTVNYDGTAKFRTTVGDGAFIGCNTNLVAPVRIGAGAYTAAGSTITDDVPEGSLAIARSPQTVKVQWAAKRRRKS